MNFVADLVEPGKHRDALILRHFSWEAAKLFRRDFLRLDGALQQRLHAGIRELAERYLTDEVARQLDVYKRLLFRLAQHGTVDDVSDLIRYDVDHGDPPMAGDGGRWYAAYPGFRDAARPLPDDWFDITDSAADWLAKLNVVTVAWGSLRGRRTLDITARSALPELVDRCTEVGVTAGNVPATGVEVRPGADGTTVRARFAVDDLLAGDPRRGQGHPVRVSVAALGTNGASPLRARRVGPAGRQVVRRGTRLYMINPMTNNRGRLVIAVTPLTLRRAIGRLRRRLPQGGRAT
jgi:hypothetical protein